MSTTVTQTTIPKKFHEAVVKWQEMFIPDYPFLIENWKKYFPHQPTFELCAYHDCSRARRGWPGGRATAPGCAPGRR